MKHRVSDAMSSIAAVFLAIIGFLSSLSVFVAISNLFWKRSNNDRDYTRTPPPPLLPNNHTGESDYRNDFITPAVNDGVHIQVIGSPTPNTATPLHVDHIPLSPSTMPDEHHVEIESLKGPHHDDLDYLVQEQRRLQQHLLQPPIREETLVHFDTPGIQTGNEPQPMHVDTQQDRPIPESETLPQTLDATLDRPESTEQQAATIPDQISPPSEPPESQHQVFEQDQHPDQGLVQPESNSLPDTPSESAAPTAEDVTLSATDHAEFRHNATNSVISYASTATSDEDWKEEEIPIAVCDSAEQPLTDSNADTPEDMHQEQSDDLAQHQECEPVLEQDSSESVQQNPEVDRELLCSIRKPLMPKQRKPKSHTKPNEFQPVDTNIDAPSDERLQQFIGEPDVEDEPDGGSQEAEQKPPKRPTGGVAMIGMDGADLRKNLKKNKRKHKR